MKKKLTYSLIIFDWDGTLIDTRYAIVHAIQKTARDLQLKVPTAENIRSGIGLTVVDQVDRLFPATDHDVFVSCYRSNLLLFEDTMHLFDGVLETLEYLAQQKYLLTIATSQIRSKLNPMLVKFNLDHFFCTSRCGDDKFSKPNPEVLLEILEELTIKPQDAVLIGDSKYDMQTATSAGVDKIAVSYGVGKKEELVKYEPIACVNKLTELINLL